MQQEIQRIAYLIWEERGKPQGQDLQIWDAALDRYFWQNITIYEYWVDSDPT